MYVNSAKGIYCCLCMATTFTPNCNFIRKVLFLLACSVKCLVTILGAFATLRKQLFRQVCLSVHRPSRPPVCPLWTTGVFSWNFMPENFIKICLENSVLLTSVTFWHFTQIRKFTAVPRWIVVWSRKVSDKNCSVNQNTHSMLINFCLQDNYKECGRARQAGTHNLILYGFRTVLFAYLVIEENGSVYCKNIYTCCFIFDPSLWSGNIKFCRLTGTYNLPNSVLR